MTVKSAAPKVSPLAARRAGVLAHITSLPGPLGNGDFSHDAYRFVEFAVECGFSVWQVLPLNPTHADGSPYFSLSANAGNPLLISLDWLKDRGWLDSYDAATPAAKAEAHRRERLRTAHSGFLAEADASWRKRYREFCASTTWLDDFAAFTALNAAQGGASWVDWPSALRDRRGAAYDQALIDLAPELDFARFQQFVFFTQWSELRAYAHSRGLLLFGDLPLFVAHHSADVWANRGLFQLDRQGQLKAMAGVPPDYFAKDGQVWGNPLYRWPAHSQEGFAWWIQRLRTQQALFDLLRLDHFRGLEACWEIPADAKTARGGAWAKAPGEALLRAIQQALPELALVAEDLGEITPEVDALRRGFALPGMRVLQFGFDGDPLNLHLPHNFAPDFVAYTGTHDNATSLEWYQSLTPEGQALVRRYLPSCEPSTMPWLLIEAAMSSVAQLAVIPMQDLLNLGEGHRMNLPGTVGDNWRWRFDWTQIPAGRKPALAELIRLYGRAAKSPA